MRLRSIASCLALSAGLVLVAAPAHAEVPFGRYAIGDSVMLGARVELRSDGFRVDAVQSRRFHDAVQLVRRLVAGGHLPVDLIVALGTNGLLDAADCDEIVRRAGSDRHVFLVTVKVPRSYRDANNIRLSACAHRHDNASVIDWYGFSRFHVAWFYDDGYHLTPVGRHAYASFLDRSADAA